MKKTLFLILALCVVLSCAGCRGYVTGTTPNGAVTDTTGGTAYDYATDGTVRDYAADDTVPNTNARLNDNNINGNRNDLTRRPNARPYQAGTMDYQGSAAY